MQLSVMQAMASQVRAELARQQRSQADVAGVLAISQSSVSRRLSGTQPFSAPELARLATWLGVPVAEFYRTPERAAS